MDATSGGQRDRRRRVLSRATGRLPLRRITGVLPALPRFGRHGADAVRGVALRLARRAGWKPTVLPHPGYGSGNRVRVLGRVLLTPARAHPEDRRRAVPGWQRFLTLESPGEEVVVEVAGQRTVVRTDADGLIDVTVEVQAGLPDTGQLSAILRAGDRQVEATVHLASPGAARGVICDIDDTVLITDIATPLRAAWRTFALPMTRRAPVPGMVALLRELTSGAPHVPVIYLSSGPWNLAGPISWFLESSGYPSGALLLTDWGPTPTRWFRDGRVHKRTALERLSADLPGVRWTLVGDTGEHDPELYEAFARAQPNRVRSILLRDVTGAHPRVQWIGDVPVVYGHDGASLTASRSALPVRGPAPPAP